MMTMIGLYFAGGEQEMMEKEEEFDYVRDMVVCVRK